MLHCAAITEILFCRELSNLVRMFIFLSLMLHFLTYWQTWNMDSTCVYQMRGTPIVFGVILSKVKVMGIFMDISVAIILRTFIISLLWRGPTWLGQYSSYNLVTSLSHNYIQQQLKHEMEQLEAWMSVRDPQVKDSNVGDTIGVVEELLRRQQDFEKTVDAQEDKFTAITRATRVSVKVNGYTCKGDSCVIINLCLYCQ